MIFEISFFIVLQGSSRPILVNTMRVGLYVRKIG